MTQSQLVTRLVSSLTGQALSLERTESLPLDINSFITILLSLCSCLIFPQTSRNTKSSPVPEVQ